MRKSKIRVRTIEKNFNALKTMKIILDNNSYLKISDFCRKNKITTGVSSALIKFGIIERVNSKGIHNWRWIGGEPTVDMSVKIIKYTNKLAYESQSYKKLNKKTIVEEQVEKIMELDEYSWSRREVNGSTVVGKKETKNTLDYYSIPLLFGLVNIKVKPRFKTY